MKSKLFMMYTMLIFFVYVPSAICEINNYFKKEICTCFGESLKTDIFISYLPFIDADTKSSAFITEEATIISFAFEEAIESLLTDYELKNFKINHKDHLIKNCDTNKKIIIDIITDPSIRTEFKVNKICNTLQIDSEIDGILLGEYKNYKTHLELYIYWILIHHNTYNIEKFIISKKDYFCEDPKTSSQVLCPKITPHIQGIARDSLLQTCPAIQIFFGFYNSLRNPVKLAVRDTIRSMRKPPGKKKNIYVSNLSFIDRHSEMSMCNTETGKLISQAILHGIQLAQKGNLSIKFNEKGHILQDTDNNVNKLIKITYDNTLSTDEKKKKVFDEMMRPEKINILLTGFYTDNSSSIEIKLILFQESENKIITKVTNIDKNDWICLKNNQPKGPQLCKKAFDDISQFTKELLEGL